MAHNKEVGLKTSQNNKKPCDLLRPCSANGRRKIKSRSSSTPPLSASRLPQTQLVKTNSFSHQLSALLFCSHLLRSQARATLAMRTRLLTLPRRTRLLTTLLPETCKSWTTKVTEAMNRTHSVKTLSPWTTYYSQCNRRSKTRDRLSKQVLWQVPLEVPSS